MPEPEVSAAARRAFGNVAATQERFYESQRTRWLEKLRQDLRYAARQLRRSPVFAVTATLTLALGIGVSTAVFTVADAVLIRRLPVADQDRLILLWGETQDGRDSKIPLALDDVHDLARQSRSLRDVAFFAFRGAVPAPIQSADRALPIRLGLVSGNFFDVLGSTAAIGRALRPEDDVAGAAPVVVLSHRAWQQQFGGDSTIVGRSVSMIYTSRSYRIVGVMPQGLEYPRGTDLWAPLVAYGTAGGFLDAISGELSVLARLRPDASASQARTELTTFFRQSDAPTRYHDVRGAVHSFADTVLGDTKPAVLLVSLAAALLLFITCVNVANLLLVRALGRDKEFVMRSALGADRGRIVTQLLTESALLAVAGGALGVALASATIRVFVALAPSSVPRIDEIHVNGATLVAAVLISTVAMLISGLGPALFTTRAFSHGALQSGSRQTGGRRVRKIAEILVVAQIALAVVTLTGAGLVTRSLVRLERVNLSFEPSNLLVVSLAMRPDQLSDEQKQRAAFDLILSSTRALPGVQAVTPVVSAPFVGEGGGVDSRLSLPGQSKEESARNPVENLEVVAPNYFGMLEIPLLRGRSFTNDDRKGSPPVVIISSWVASHFWPGGDPIGKQLTMPTGEFTVVGVVPDTRYRELRTARPTVYFPLEQWPDVPSTLLVRTANSLDEIVPALRRTFANATSGITMVSASFVETLLDAPRAQPRLNATVLVLFASTALSLAAIGLFAVVATMVRQRTHELGIRMALGATSGRVGKAVMVRGLCLALAGTAIGIGVALAASRLISALLFEISPADGVTLLVVTTLMVGVAALASVVPARLGMRVDPVTALRKEN